MAGWGVAYVPSAWLVETWPPLVAAAARMGLGGLILIGVLMALGMPLRPRTGVGVVVVLALTQTVLFYGATFYGIAHGGAGLAAVLANTDPLFVAALSVPFLGERLSGGQWTGLGLGLVGAAVVVWEGPIWPPEVSGAALVVVGGALAWAIGTVAAARRLQTTAAPVALAGWQMVLGAGVLAVLGLAVEGGPEQTGAREVGLIWLTAIVGSALPFALFYLALGRAPASEVSAWFFLVPVVGVLTAWPLLGEPLTGQLIAGMALVSLGLWLVLRPGPAREPAPAPAGGGPLRSPPP
jgi:drug/metabolite transporter (DMT)-like permease